MRGEPPDPEYPGLCIPNVSRERGFFKLERNGDRVREPSNVEPFDTLVTVVFIDTTLP